MKGLNMATTILTKVTVTGADDSVSIEHLLQIQKRYPFVEFGILLSQNNSHAGTPRFPSRHWLKRLVEANEKASPHLNLSGHICGKWVKDIFLGKWPDLNAVTDNLIVAFQRFQLNTHAQPHRYSDLLFKLIDKLADECQTVIFQLDGKDGSIAARAAVEWYGNGANIAGLFDLSHGAGVLPSDWPRRIAWLQCGYAGGLSSENVAEQLGRIAEAASGDTWVDAETHLRGDRDEFSLARCEAFLEVCKPWVK
jgi:hypothetical protein